MNERWNAPVGLVSIFAAVLALPTRSASRRSMSRRSMSLRLAASAAYRSLLPELEKTTGIRINYIGSVAGKRAQHHRRATSPRRARGRGDHVEGEGSMN